MADQTPPGTPMPDVVSGIIRHVLTTAGGALVAAGYLTSDQWTTIAGALAVIIGVVWSVISKRLST
jgi:tetrahydromethanopterin S-methyltransferase subunit D